MPKVIDRVTYCSRKCYFEDGPGKKAKPCILCGEINGRRNHTGHCKQCQDKLSIIKCIYCGKEFRRENVQRYCSDECRKNKIKEQVFIYNKSKKELNAIVCKECGKEFTPEYGNKRRMFCSDKCLYRFRSRESKYIRRSRERAARKSGGINRLAIFKRDNWKCHICGKKINKKAKCPHPLSPTIDHYIPLAYGGSHTEDNVRCAHFICNSRRGTPDAIQLTIFY
jgi:YHS domain-containing protein